MADTTGSDAQAQRLKDLASSPSITGLPGLIFAPDENGSIMVPLKHARVLHLIVNDPESTDSKDRFMAGLRLGAWFQHGLKVIVDNPNMKLANNRMYSLIQDSVRSEHAHLATRSKFAAKHLKTMFVTMQQACIRFLKDEATTETPIVDGVPDVETAFLQPLELWVNYLTGKKDCFRQAKAFVEAADWVSKVLEDCKDKTGIDVTIAPAAPLAGLEDSAPSSGTRKRPRLDDDAGTAIMPTEEAINDVLAMFLPSDMSRQHAHDRLNLYLQEIKRNIEQLAEAEIGKLGIDNRDLRVEIATVLGEKAEAVAILQRELNEKNAEISEKTAENGDALARIADLEVEMAKFRIDAEIAGMPASETNYRIQRANERIEIAELQTRAAEEELQDARAIIQARDEELQVTKAIIQDRDEELQVAVAEAQAAEEQEQVAKKEMEDVRASQDELIKARDAAMEEMRAELAAKDKEMEEILRQKAELAQKITGSQKGGSSTVMMDLDTKTE